MLTLLDMLMGGFAAAILVVALVIGIFFFYKSRKLHLNLLSIAAIMIIFASLFYFITAFDFVTVLLTGTNTTIPNDIQAITTYIWVAPILLCAIYIGAQLLMPQKKWTIVLLYSILGVIFEIFLLLDPLGTVKIIYPPNPGEGLIDNSFNLSSPAFILVAIFLLSAVIFNGIGFLYKSTQVGPPIRNNFRLLGLGFLIFCTCSVFDALMAPGYILIATRIGMMITPLFMYYGLKPQ